MTIEQQLANQMFEQLSVDDRRNYTDKGWYAGICNNCLNGEDPETVGDELIALVMDWQDNNEEGVQYTFELQLNGTGRTLQEAWEDAVSAFADDPGIAPSEWQLTE